METLSLGIGPHWDWGNVVVWSAVGTEFNPVSVQLRPVCQKTKTSVMMDEWHVGNCILCSFAFCVPVHMISSSIVYCILLSRCKHV